MANHENRVEVACVVLPPTSTTTVNEDIANAAAMARPLKLSPRHIDEEESTPEQIAVF